MKFTIVNIFEEKKKEKEEILMYINGIHKNLVNNPSFENVEFRIRHYHIE